jgi:hypothetical protein
MEFKTKCPYCKIGFSVMCESKEKLMHLDICWSSDSGLQRNCSDLEAITPHIVDNPDYGTKFSLSKEMQEKFDELNESFHSDPSEFSKLNTEFENFLVLIGEFFRYSDWMDDREVKEGSGNKILEDLYEEGLNLLQIMEKISVKI